MYMLMTKANVFKLSIELPELYPISSIQSNKTSLNFSWPFSSNLNIVFMSTHGLSKMSNPASGKIVEITIMTWAGKIVRSMGRCSIIYSDLMKISMYFIALLKIMFRPKDITNIHLNPWFTDSAESSITIREAGSCFGIFELRMPLKAIPPI